MLLFNKGNRIFYLKKPTEGATFNILWQLYENRDMTEDMMCGKNEEYVILKMDKENLNPLSYKIVPYPWAPGFPWLINVTIPNKWMQ